MQQMIHAIPGGVILQLRVAPRASKSAVDGIRDGILKVRVHAPPVEGAANQELVALLARVLDVPKRSVTLLAGGHSRSKRLQIDRIDVETALQRLDAT